jgi:membrane protein required for colicin V production
VNWLDLVILLILGLEMVLGWREGLIGVSAKLGGFVLGLYLAARYSGQVAGLLGTYLVGPPLLLRVLAFLALLLAGRYTLLTLGLLLKRTLAVPGLATLDRLAGACLGLAIGTAVVMLLVSLLAWLPWPQLAQAVQASELGQYFWSAAPVFSRFFWGDVAPSLTPSRIIPGGQQAGCPSLFASL